MIPIVSPAEMKAIDEAAPEPEGVLVERAGAAVARAALRMLGGAYGRRVVVVAGKGNNGADGRVAAVRLAARGVRVVVVDAAGSADGSQLPPCDLVIDAAYGTGFRGEYKAPDPGGARVLAVDIPSGVEGLTGAAGVGAVRAERTVTFAALKPGLLLGRGAELAGEVELADIGLDTSGATAWLVTESDVREWLPARPREAHKWQSAMWVVAGSPGMTGAATLCSTAAMRSGAGMVRLGVPGSERGDQGVGAGPTEVVGRPLPATGWDTEVLADLDRCKALVVGPGLGRSDATGEAVRRLVAAARVPVLVDADGLFALGAAPDLGGRAAGTVLTPHVGEFTRLAGAAPGDDRPAAVRDLAARTGATVLLKGSTTIVAEPGGRSLWADEGDSRLATAGTGDVLSGVIGAFLARGLDPLRAAAAGAWVHGAAARLGHRDGFVAGDLLAALPQVLSR